MQERALRFVYEDHTCSYGMLEKAKDLHCILQDREQWQLKLSILLINEHQFVYKIY